MFNFLEPLVLIFLFLNFVGKHPWALLLVAGEGAFIYRCLKKNGSKRAGLIAASLTIAVTGVLFAIFLHFAPGWC